MQARPHISIEVSDLKASIQFYSLVFRMSPSKKREDYANYRLDSPGLHLSLEYYPDRISGNPFPNQHFGIELFDHEDLMEWQHWLENVGVNYLVEEQVTCCYAVGDKFWLTDPDGHRWEFWVRTDEADLMHGETDHFAQSSSSSPSSSTSSSKCCVPEQDTLARDQINGAQTGVPTVLASASRMSSETAMEVMSPEPTSSCCG